MSIFDRFFEHFKWIVERKDFDSFWPIGLGTAGPRYWRNLVLDLEQSFKDNKDFLIFDYPTTYTTLVGSVFFAMRELRWSPDRCRALIEYIFYNAQKAKHGDLLNETGKNLIWHNRLAVEKFSFGYPLLNDKISILDIYDLSASILALAECEYFWNHRIATEKHGPYFGDDGNVYIVRSCKNLAPIDLWPELTTLSLNNDEFHLIFKYKPHEVRFDLLSNLITPLPPDKDLLGVSLSAFSFFNGNNIHVFLNSLHDAIRILCFSISKMNERERAEKATEILYYSCRNFLPQWRKQASNAILDGRTYTIRNPMPKELNNRLKYCDLRENY